MSLVDAIFGGSATPSETTKELFLTSDHEVGLKSESKKKKKNKRSKNNDVEQGDGGEHDQHNGSESNDKKSAIKNISSLFDQSIKLPEPIRPISKTKISSSNKNIPIEDTSSKKRKFDSKLSNDIESRNNSDNKQTSDQNNLSSRERVEDNHQGVKENFIRNDEADDRTIYVGNLPYYSTRRDLHRLFIDCGAIDSERIRCVAPTDDINIKLPDNKKGNAKLHKKICINTGLAYANNETNRTKSSVSGYVVFKDTTSVAKALLKNNMAVPDTGSGIKLHQNASKKIKKEQNNGDNAQDEDDGDNDGSFSLLPDSSNSSVGVRHIRVDTVKPSTYEPSLSIFVGNLPYEADEETLLKHFDNLLSDANDVKDDTNNDGHDQSFTIVHGVRIVRDKDTMKCKGFGYVLLSNKSYVAKALQIFSSIHDRHKSEKTSKKAKIDHRDSRSSDPSINSKLLYMNRLPRVLVCGKGGRKKEKKDRQTPDKEREFDIHNELSKGTTTGAYKRILKRELMNPDNVGGIKSGAGNNSIDQNEMKKSSFASLLMKPLGASSHNGSGMKKKKRGSTPSMKNKMMPTKPMSQSKRSISQTKTKKRTQKIEKRITKGMGKNRVK